ncbi:hypothetical protein BGZ63DRAFT_348688 [Mariannaea sp. PMI_226]|nr:hypothetical protein BGZ63DRAFT_348688 [Mariannaea sp. PMI_226]
MKIPYNILHVSGNVLFAGRGGKIHSFSLSDGTHLSTWKHPDVEKVDAAVRSNMEKTSEMVSIVESSGNPEGGDDNGPPAKRQRLEGSTDETSKESNRETQQDSNPAEGSENQNDGGKEKQKGKKSKNRQNNEKRKEPQMRVPDRPVITHMTSTSDGAHLLAITGHDKVIWVFKHDGNGIITQLSRRTMPKRPSSVVIGPDSQIICADKFGDVYALPLIEDSSFSGTPQPSTPSLAVSKPILTSKPAANTTTVHSKRNLRALANQQQQMELATRTKTDPVAKSELPEFEMTLLLGHVSMLTSLILGDSEGRRYILTADRDEHIRVSRYIPQAYVIENFCFGHKDFVSAMAIPSSRKDILISGGGDEDLFVWDWKASRLLSKKSILSLAQEIMPNLTKIAVSGLKTFVYPTEGGELTYVAAVCEEIKAVFSWQLTEDNVLNHPSVIQLPGNLLDVEVVLGADGELPKLVTAVDVGEQTDAKSLVIYSLIMTDEKLAVGEISFVRDAELEAEELDIKEDAVRGLLYNTENLRKQVTEEGGDEQGGEGLEIPDVEAMEE